MKDPFEIALEALERRGETLDKTLQQQRERFGETEAEEYERDAAAVANMTKVRR
jgi:hypothetical protein